MPDLAGSSDDGSKNRDLLAKLVGVARLDAEPEAAVETIRLCGGLPLAMRIVG